MFSKCISNLLKEVARIIQKKKIVNIYNYATSEDTKYKRIHKEKQYEDFLNKIRDTAFLTNSQII